MQKRGMLLLFFVLAEVWVRNRAGFEGFGFLLLKPRGDVVKVNAPLPSELDVWYFPGLN